MTWSSGVRRLTHHIIPDSAANYKRRAKYMLTHSDQPAPAVATVVLLLYSRATAAELDWLAAVAQPKCTEVPNYPHNCHAIPIFVHHGLTLAIH